MTVDDYINQQTPDHQRILRWLRQLILTADGAVREKIAWNIPVYSYQQRHVCYLNVLRLERAPSEGRSAAAVDLAFMRGNELPDDAGRLESRDRKVIKSLVIRDISALDEDLIRTYIQEALLLSRVER